MFSAPSAFPLSSSIGPPIADSAATNNGSSSSVVDRAGPLVCASSRIQSTGHRLETCERAQDDGFGHRAARPLEQFAAARDAVRGRCRPEEQRGAQRIDDARLLLPVAGSDGVTESLLALSRGFAERTALARRKGDSAVGAGEAEIVVEPFEHLGGLAGERLELDRVAVATDSGALEAHVPLDLLVSRSACGLECVFEHLGRAL